jgi:hypothetical protein
MTNELTWDRTLAAAMGSRQLTAWAMARPVTSLEQFLYKYFILLLCDVLRTHAVTVKYFI